MTLNLIMLHGSRASAKVFTDHAAALSHLGRIVPLNMLGHGGRRVPEVFTVEAMAKDVIAQMDEQDIETAYVFGYSFGGYIALYLARYYPQRILGAITLATKWIFDQHTVNFFTRLSNTERIKRIPKMRAEMDDYHSGVDWNGIVSGLAYLYRFLGSVPALTNKELASIQQPCLVISASHDQLVPWSESLWLANLIPQGHGFTFAGKAHPLEIIPVKFLVGIIEPWLKIQAPQHNFG
jgi:pimeloyl-ACP methyl ester carboxylesterase